MRKQETRKRKKAKRVRKSRHHKSRHHKSRHHKSRHHKSHTKRSSHRRIHGGSYLQATDREVDDMPVTRDAVITTSEGGPPMSVRAFEDHALYRDFQGLRT